MKFKILALITLFIFLNSNAAEEMQSVAKQELYSKIAELSESIANIKRSIVISENAIKNSAGWATLPLNRHAHIKQRTFEIQKEIDAKKIKRDEKIKERRELLQTLEQNSEK